jgi:exonuclease III
MESLVINISRYHGTQFLNKKTQACRVHAKQDPLFCCIQEYKKHISATDRYDLRVKGLEKVFPMNRLKNQPGVAILILKKINFQKKNYQKRWEVKLYTH